MYAKRLLLSLFLMFCVVVALVLMSSDATTAAPQPGASGLAAAGKPVKTPRPTKEPTPLPTSTSAPWPPLTATPGPSPTPFPAPAEPIYWGVAMEGVPWDIPKLETWESSVTQKRVAIVHFWHFWNGSGDGGYNPWSDTPANNARDHGSIPMITWASEGGNDPRRWKLSTIYNGEHDAYITAFAQEAKRWGKPFFLRWGHEMNGNWSFTWQETQNGNSPGEFVVAWQHMHDIFNRVYSEPQWDGDVSKPMSSYVQWVWCPNVEFENSTWPTFGSLYPGDQYVDWTCLDGYNRKESWISFTDLYTYSYRELVGPPLPDRTPVAPGKPVMIGEWGSEEGDNEGESKASWIEDAIGVQIPLNFPRIKAHVWYNWLFAGDDWRIETSGWSQEYWARNIAPSYYLDNQFATLEVFPPPAPAPAP